MQLNGDKFELLRYGTDENLQSRTSYMSNTRQPIQDKDTVRDLGVAMSKDGTFKKQIQDVIAEATRQCGWILRTFATREQEPMLTLFKSLVLCKLDYCSQLWCPTTKGNIQAIEMVQRSFVRKISGITNLSYW